MSVCEDGGLCEASNTHQVHGGVQLSHELLAPLPGLLDFSHGLAVGPPSQPGGEGAQPDVVVGLPLLEASHGVRLQLCHVGQETAQMLDYSPS